MLLGLATLLAIRPAFGSSSDGRKFYMLVVAEQPDTAAKPVLPTPAQPVYYVAYDTGYIEAGDAIGGEHPPGPAVVAQALHQTLAAQGFRPGTVQSPPSVALFYSWGLLNVDSHEIRSSDRLGLNLKARIALVASSEYARLMEQDILDRRQPVWVRTPILNYRERDLMDFARDERYFVVVSAYDFAALSRGETKLLWRTKMSTRSVGVTMDEAMPALLGAGGPYVGRNLRETANLHAPLVPAWSGAAVGPGGQETAPPPATVSQVDERFLQDLVAREHLEFSGERFEARPNNGSRPAAATSAPAAQSLLPAALASRVDAYQREKSALQEGLAAQVKAHSPGTDTRQAIDAFNQENAPRIQALAREREAIRDELSRLAAASTDPAAGKSLSALLQEFTADVRQLDAPAGAAGK
jgi:hypothetical protein